MSELSFKNIELGAIYEIRYCPFDVASILMIVKFTKTNEEQDCAFIDILYADSNYFNIYGGTIGRLISIYGVKHIKKLN